MTQSICTITLTLATAALLAAQGLRTDLPDVRPELIRTHLEVLASDAQEGRMTGTPGFDRAARYVTEQFEKLGLEPAFGGRFQQPLSLRHTRAIGAESSIALRRGSQELRLAFDTDFVSSGDIHRESLEVSAPIVFVGDGVSAPGQNFDDYTRVDVRDKIVAMVLRRIPQLGPAESAYFGHIDVRVENAVRRGAVGFLMLGADADYPWEFNQQRAFQGLHSIADPSGQPREPSKPIAVAVLQYTAARRIFDLASLDYADTLTANSSRQLPSIELPVTATIRIRSTHSTLDTANIGVVLRGSDPKLKDEFVVFSAHLDHVGRGIPVNGDDIYNGAIDNASGVSEMLAMAEATTRLAHRPRRSMLFLATAGEEIGNLGAKYFVAQPPMPLRNIAALVNVDGPTLMLYPVTGVNALGGAHSTLGQVAATAAARLRLRITQTISPTGGDQGPFLMRGVPLLWPLSLPDPNRPGMDEAAGERAWGARNYHKPTDDLTQISDYGAAAAMAQYDLLVGLQVAQEDAKPQWLLGDFYGDTFGRATSR
jgi:hypothetical protein